MSNGLIQTDPNLENT